SPPRSIPPHLHRRATPATSIPTVRTRTTAAITIITRIPTPISPASTATIIRTDEPARRRASILEHRSDGVGSQHALEIAFERLRCRCIQTSLMDRVQNLELELEQQLAAQCGDAAFFT